MAALPSDVLRETKYDPEKARERVRSGVTWTFIILFSVVLGYLGAALFVPAPTDQWSRLKEVMEIVLPAVTGTLGTALGFYFGTQSKN